MKGPGAYRDLVRIDRDSRTGDNPQPDYTGQPRHTKVPCKITVTAGIEVFRGRQLKAEITHLVEMQRLRDIEMTDRLTVIGGHQNGKSLHIVSVLPKDYDGKTPKIELACKELA